jgi:hypothetical protein
MLSSSLRDRDRLHVLRELTKGAPHGGTRRPGLSLGNVRRLTQQSREVGDEAVIHRGGGQTSNDRIEDRIGVDHDPPWPSTYQAAINRGLSDSRDQYAL